jgi:hypothetical protein
MSKLPTIKDVSALVRDVKRCGIADDCRAFQEDDLPGIQLTVGWNPENGEWSWQSGDNSYSGSAYFFPIWGVAGVYRRSNSREVAKDIISQLDEQTW